MIGWALKVALAWVLLDVVLMFCWALLCEVGRRRR